MDTILNSSQQTFELPAGGALTMRQASPLAAAVCALQSAEGATGFTTAALVSSTPVTVGPFVVNCKLMVATIGKVAIDVAVGVAAAPGGGNSAAQTVTFTTALPLDTVGAGKKFDEHPMTAVTPFTLGAGAVEEGNVTFCLTGDGDPTHIPTWPISWVISGGAFKPAAGQQNIYSVVYGYAGVLVFRNDGRLVVAPPGTTTGLGASMTSTTALLSWTAPASGGVVVDYLIEYKAAASGTWLTWSHAASTAVAATITGLTPSTAYNFRVSAVNSGGNGTAATANGTTNAAAVTIASDSFTAADNTSFAGRVTPVGSKAYINTSGTPCIIQSNAARAPVGDWSDEQIDIGVTSYHAEIDITSLGGTGMITGMGLNFRVVDHSNMYFAIANDANTITVYKADWAGGTFWTTVPGASLTQAGIGSHISVDVTPAGWTVRGAGGAVVFTAPSDTYNATATKCGFHCGDPAGRLDNFLVTT